MVVVGGIVVVEVIVVEVVEVVVNVVEVVEGVVLALVYTVLLDSINI